MKKLVCTFLFAALVGAVTAAHAVDGDGVSWEKDVDRAFERAAKEDKLVFVDVYADWCGPCKMMDKNTFSDSSVQELLSEKFIALKVNADNDQAAAREFGTGSLPTLTVLTPDRAPVVQQPGYHPPEAFLSLLEDAQENVTRLARLEEDVKQSPGDAAKAMDLGREYLMLQRGDDALRVFKGVSGDAAAALPAETKPEFDYLYALAHVAGDEFEQAANLLGSFLEAYPEDARADRADRLAVESLYLAGNQALDAGDAKTAARHFQQVLDQSDDYPQLAMQVQARLDIAKLLNSPAPTFKVAEWVGEASPTVEDLKGKVVLVDFFQIICPGCKRAKPMIEDLQKKYGDRGFQVVGIATAFENLGMQQADDIKSYVAQNDFAWPVAVDEGLKETFTRYAAMGSPWTVLIDREGVVRHADFFDPAVVESTIKELI
jgi:thiol-disulfide isomerase/thioredoxin